MEFVIALSLKVVLVQNFTLRSAKPCNNIKILLSKQAAPPFFNSISTKIVNKKKKACWQWIHIRNTEYKNPSTFIFHFRSLIYGILLYIGKTEKKMNV